MAKIRTPPIHSEAFHPAHLMAAAHLLVLINNLITCKGDKQK